MSSGGARSPLPIDAELGAVAGAVSRAGAAVLVAPPGAGQTTRVPEAVAGAVRGDVLVVEPRRMAARLAAHRIAAERGERVGDHVGYEVRFERRVSSATRIRFVTEGVLSRRLIGDPELAGVGAVILDEFHERSLSADLALALCRRLQRGARPDLTVVVMSATLEPEPVATFLGDCPIVVSLLKKIARNLSSRSSGSRGAQCARRQSVHSLSPGVYTTGASRRCMRCTCTASATCR